MHMCKEKNNGTVLDGHYSVSRALGDRWGRVGEKIDQHRHGLGLYSRSHIDLQDICQGVQCNQLSWGVAILHVYVDGWVGVGERIRNSFQKIIVNSGVEISLSYPPKTTVHRKYRLWSRPCRWGPCQQSKVQRRCSLVSPLLSRVWTIWSKRVYHFLHSHAHAIITHRHTHTHQRMVTVYCAPQHHVHSNEYLTQHRQTTNTGGESSSKRVVVESGIKHNQDNEPLWREAEEHHFLWLLCAQRHGLEKKSEVKKEINQWAMGESIAASPRIFICKEEAGRLHANSLEMWK